MAKRPEESIFGIGHGVLSLYNTSKLRSANSQITRIQDQQIRNTEMTISAIRESNRLTLSAIKSVAELQMATMSGLVVMDSKLDEISKMAWDLQNYFKTRDEREAFLKGLAMDIEEQVDFIRGYCSDYPEYAIVQIEELRGIIAYHGVLPEHYLILSNVSDIKWAKNVLNSVEGIYFELTSNLGD